jgi:hypothetical protein
MTRTLGAAFVCVLLMPAGAAAHRLDEYLQAARVSLARDGVTIDVDLTPGASVAPAVLEIVDADRDGALSPIEAGAYGRAVLGDLVLELDGRPVALTLHRVEASSPGEMRDGMGTIQVRAVGRIGPLRAGHHQLYFRNNHRPGGSVYLVNALIPDDRSVSVTGQTRDVRQQEGRIDYTVGARWPAQAGWLLAGGACLCAIALRRRTAAGRQG